DTESEDLLVEEEVLPVNAEEPTMLAAADDEAEDILEESETASVADESEEDEFEQRIQEDIAVTEKINDHLEADENEEDRDRALQMIGSGVPLAKDNTELED